MARRGYYREVLQFRAGKGAFDQIRQAAAGNPAVAIRLFQTFARLSEHIEEPRYREALLDQIDALWEGAEGATLAKSDRADIEDAYRRACEAFGRR